MDSQNILPSVRTNVAGTGAVSILPASGRANCCRHIAALIITTINAAASTVTISDGTKTVLVLDYPNAASAPSVPVSLRFNFPLEQSIANLAWTATASVNASGFNITVQYVEN